MNDTPQVTGSWKWPTWWQWLVIVGVVALNVAPYAVAFWASGSFSKLEWLLWSLLSAPFAHTAMLSFFLIAGKSSVFLRRLLFFAGLLGIQGLLILALDDNSVGTIAWFLIQALIIMTLTLGSALLFGVPSRPKHWLPQFSLAEILPHCVLLGMLFVMIRLAEATNFEYWRQAADPSFIAFTIASAFYLFPICLATILRGRVKMTAVILFCLLLWPPFPWMVVELVEVMESTPTLPDGTYLMLFYPAFAIQLLLVWSTLFPIRACFPGVLLERTLPEEALNDQANPEQEQLTDEQDFLGMQ